jgi:phosphoserine phosphatase
MKSINVIDLDKTLIPFDSFRYLIIHELKRLNLKIISLVILKKVGFISSKRLKDLVLRVLKLDKNIKLKDKIVELINNSIDREVLEKVKRESDKDTINILCSASSNSYIKEVAKNLKWVGYGSYVKEDNFYHMYGINKLKFIKSKFPKTKYRYNFAISDNINDLVLLEEFKKYEIVEPKKVKRSVI